MKELSIEEKAKAYDDAIERAIRMFSEKELNYLFPEFTESEDEKIRKVLIGWINLEPSTSFNNTFDGFSKEQILAWLENKSRRR